MTHCIPSEFRRIQGRHQATMGRRVFTLIELLFLISIVALLMAILLPALESRPGGRQDRIVQQSAAVDHAALYTFAGDNDGKLPVGSVHGTGGNHAYFGSYRRFWPWDQPGSFPDLYHDGHLFALTVFFCPDGSFPDPRAPFGSYPGSRTFHYNDNNGWIMFIGCNVYANARGTAVLLPGE